MSLKQFSSHQNFFWLMWAGPRICINQQMVGLIPFAPDLRACGELSNYTLFLIPFSFKLQIIFIISHRTGQVCKQTQLIILNNLKHIFACTFCFSLFVTAG